MIYRRLLLRESFDTVYAPQFANPLRFRPVPVCSALLVRAVGGGWLAGQRFVLRGKSLRNPSASPSL
jgi:hypothetical protein